MPTCTYVLSRTRHAFPRTLPIGACVHAHPNEDGGWHRGFFRGFPMKRTLSISEQDIDAMGFLYACGLSTLKIGRLFDILGGSVHRRLVNRGVEMRTLSQALRRPPVRHLHSHGYIMIGIEYEHRLVAAEKLGRELKLGEVVHHKNGNRTDNRPANLEVIPSNGQHMSTHHPSRSIFTREEDALILRLEQEGMTHAEIGVRMNKSWGSIAGRWNTLRTRHGLPPKKRGGKQTFRKTFGDVFGEERRDEAE